MKIQLSEHVRLVFPVCFMAFFLLFSPYRADAAEGYKTYANSRFGYVVEYPDVFWSRFEPDNGDGVKLATANGHSELTIWGQHNTEGKSAGDILKARLRDAAHIVPDSAASGDNWYTLTLTDDGGFNGIEHYFLEYGIVSEDAIAAFTFRYPLNMGFEEAAGRLKKTLRFGSGAGDALVQADLRAMSPEYELNLEDEKVYRVTGGEKKAVGEALKISSEMGEYYWFAVSAEADEAMKGSASGLYFFYENGIFVAFLPSRAAEFAGDARLNPTAEQFLIDFGTSPERDLRLYDFRTLKEKKAFLAMDDIVWLDARRFAMTFVDTAKKPRSKNALESGWLSVAVYDATTGKLTCVREATETSDFMLDGADLEAKKFTINERSVKKTGDWGSEENITLREFQTDF